MRIFNTATRQKEELTPLQPGRFNIYVCGPTVYDLFHLGNARPFITYDTLRRYLLYRGYEVNYIQNFTDIDDKIIARATREGITAKELSQHMIKEYFKDADALNIMRATKHPLATETIAEIIKLIETLMDKGYAYIAPDGVYYDIAKFQDYGKLSHHNLEDLEAGASERVSQNQGKHNALDFALWKFKKEGEPYWPSPWGDGRPGWHIECSAMCLANIGETVDIHCGGVDLVFPHHENEIAQSEAATGKTFVRYWMHNGFININHIKMSKSQGNFFMVRDLAKLYPYEIIRFYMLQSHYRMPINFTLTDSGSSDEQNTMDAAVASFKRIKTCVDSLDFQISNLDAAAVDAVASEELSKAAKAAQKLFCKAMDDDLNTADAIAVIFELVKQANLALAAKNVDAASLRAARDMIVELMQVLGFDVSKSSEDAIPREILDMVQERAAAKKNRDYAKADKIRDAVTAKGYRIDDTPEGPRVFPLD